MECGILLLLPLLLLTHLLLVRAADDVDTQVNAGNASAVNECYWSGDGPVCHGKCRDGETVVSESKKNDGTCILIVFSIENKMDFNIFLWFRKRLHHWQENVKI